MDKKQWMLITALLGVVVLVAGFMFLVKPQHSKADKIKAQAVSVQQTTQSLRAQAAELLTKKKGLGAEEARLSQVVAKLPEGVELPTLTRQISAAATGTNVDLSTFAPGPPVALAAPGTTASSTTGKSSAVAGGTTTSGTTPAANPGTTASTATAGTTSASSEVEQIPLSMTVSGTYFEIESFLAALEDMPRAVLVDTLGLTYQGTAPSPVTPGSGELTANITARAFMTTSSLTGAVAQ